MAERRLSLKRSWSGKTSHERRQKKEEQEEGPPLRQGAASKKVGKGMRS